MPHRLNEPSPLTSDAVILFYYGLGMLSLLMGFTGLLAYMGALFSRTLAQKSKDEFAQSHCTWIMHSVCVVYGFWSVLIFLSFIFFLLADISLPHGFSFQSLEAIKATPSLQGVYHTFLTFFGMLMSVSLWFVYRMVRGAYMLVRLRPPREE